MDISSFVPGEILSDMSFRINNLFLNTARFFFLFQQASQFADKKAPELLPALF
jgi:hypothetical protein